METGLFCRRLGSVLDELSTTAAHADVSPDAVRRARRATARVLNCGRDARLSSSQVRRAEAYFAAVISRSTVRGVAGPRAAARLVAAAVVADLHEAGRDDVAIWQELERGWGARIPADVLEEYRHRLCG